MNRFHNVSALNMCTFAAVPRCSLWVIHSVVSLLSFSCLCFSCFSVSLFQCFFLFFVVVVFFCLFECPQRMELGKPNQSSSNLVYLLLYRANFCEEYTFPNLPLWLPFYGKHSIQAFSPATPWQLLFSVSPVTIPVPNSRPVLRPGSFSYHSIAVFITTKVLPGPVWLHGHHTRLVFLPLHWPLLSFCRFFLSLTSA